MNCPICLNFTKKQIKLECNHEFCFACIKKWILYKKSNCPMCRQNTKYFDRHTRSYSIAKQIRNPAINDWNYLIMKYNKKIPVYIFIRFLNIYIIPYMNIWRRPLMKEFLSYMYSICIFKNVRHRPCLTMQEQEIINKFMIQY